MSTRATFCIAVVCAAIAGCGTMSSAQDTQVSTMTRIKGKKCTNESSKCEIIVSVVCSSNGCTAPTVDPEVVLVGDKKKVKLTWTIPTGVAYKFDSVDGIVVLDIPVGEFTCGPSGSDGKTFECKNQHGAFGVYKYSVHLIGADSTSLRLDPMIIND